MSLEQTIARLELNRLILNEHKCKKFIEIIKKQAKDVENELEERTKLLDEIRLVEQLNDFTQLNESYASTLESVADDVKNDVPTIRSIQNSFEMRENRSKEAIELICYLLNCIQ